MLKFFSLYSVVNSTAVSKFNIDQLTDHINKFRDEATIYADNNRFVFFLGDNNTTETGIKNALTSLDGKLEVSIFDELRSGFVTADFPSLFAETERVFTDKFEQNIRDMIMNNIIEKFENDAGFWFERSNKTVAEGSTPWYVGGANVETAWTTTKGAGQTVMLMGKGVDSAHPNLALWANSKELNDGTDNDGNGYIDDIHGISSYYHNGNIEQYFNNLISLPRRGLDTYDDFSNQMALVISGSSNEHGSVGVAPESKILPCNVVLGSDIFRCILYARDNGVKVIHFGLGADIEDAMIDFFYKGYYEETFTVALNFCKEHDMLIVMGASGGGRKKRFDLSDFDIIQTIRHPNLITVTGIDASGELGLECNFSSTVVDVAAPGVDFVLPLTDGTYIQRSGTSLAAGVVAGCISMMFSANPGISADRARLLAIQAVEKEDEFDFVLSGGRFDCGKAVESAVVDTTPVPTTVPTATTAVSTITNTTMDKSTSTVVESECFLQNFDYEGNDIIGLNVLTPFECLDLCRSTPGCKYYSHNVRYNTKCWLKTSASGKRSYLTSVSGSVSCQSNNTCKISHVAYSGSVIKSSSVQFSEECMLECRSTAECSYWSFFKGVCRLLKNVTDAQYKEWSYGGAATC